MNYFHKEEKHICIIHEGHRDHKCEYCGKSFPHSENLKQHNAICEKTSLKSQVEGVHERERDHKCEEYKEENTKLKHENEILNSIIENLEEENKALKCHFSSMKNQHPYEETIDNEDYNDYKCEFLGKSFSEGEKLKSHIQIHDNERIKMTGTQSLRLTKFKCEICKKEITGKYNFKVHMENVHEELKRYKCNKCDKNFTQNIALKLHISAVHEKMKKFNCNQCGKHFAKGFNLKIHIQNVHEKEKISTKHHEYEPIYDVMSGTQHMRYAKFKCEPCNKIITGKYNFKVHRENVHEGKKKYVCHRCDKHFTQNIGLKRHIIAVHEKK